jgi:hypothetical protein
MKSRPPSIFRGRRNQRFHNPTYLTSCAMLGMPYRWSEQISPTNGSGRTHHPRATRAPKVRVMVQGNREGDTAPHRARDKRLSHQDATMARRRGTGVGVSRVNRDQAHHKGGGGGPPLKGDSTKAKGEMRITVGPHHIVDRFLQGGTCSETGAQGGWTNITQRLRR